MCGSRTGLRRLHVCTYGSEVNESMGLLSVVLEGSDCLQRRRLDLVSFHGGDLYCTCSSGCGHSAAPNGVSGLAVRLDLLTKDFHRGINVNIS